MKWPKWIIIACACSLAGCQQAAPPLCLILLEPPAINQPAQLVKQEPELARYVMLIDKIGEKHGCWPIRARGNKAHHKGDKNERNHP